jgi:hypothetical protein
VSTEQINRLYGVVSLGMDNVESRVRRGKSWRKIRVALCVTEVKCLVNRSLGSSRRPRYQTYEFHGITVCWKWRGAGGTGRRRVKKMASVVYGVENTKMADILVHFFKHVPEICCFH